MKVTLRQVRRLILWMVLLLLVAGGGYFLGQRKITFEKKKLIPKISIERTLPASKEADVDFSLFWAVWDRLESQYLGRKTLDYRQMVYGAISGMVASLDDPYTVFLPPTENKESKDDLRGDFEGVGIQIGYDKDKRLAVISPLSGTPAEAAGLKSGDLILRIVDEKQGIDKDTVGISLPEAVSLIRGLRGTTVKLTILKVGGQEPFEVTLKRDTIVVKSVELKFNEENNQSVAILKLSRFGERTYQEWEEAVQEIVNYKSQNTNYKGVILDLRNNPGGFLQGSVYFASEFIPSGVIVQQDRGEDGGETYSVNRKGQLLKDPLVVLVNGGSASASEIVAGALQEKGRAKLVGEKTFGKGTIQEAEDLSGGAGLHITVARWLLPSGKSIDKVGVNPDFEVKMDETDQTKDPPLEKALELLIK